MAIVANPNSEPRVSAQVEKKMPGGRGEVAEMKSSSEICDHDVLQRPKRNKTPGVRVVGGRIYDPENGKTCHQGTMTTSPKKLGKENIFDGKTCLNVIPPVEEKPNKKKRKGLKVLQDVNGVHDASPNKTTHHDLKHEGLNQTHKAIVLQETSGHSDKKKLKKMKTEGYPKHGISSEKIDGVQQEEKTFKMNKVDKDTKALDIRSDQNTKKGVNVKKCQQAKNNAFNLDGKYLEAVIPLPTGSELLTIAGVDFPKEDAGNALQLLEFCAAFGKFLNVKRGQAEVVLRELIKGRSARRGKYSSIIQFHIQLLSVIQEDMGSETPLFDPTHGDDTWLKALKSCIPKSKYLLEAFDCLDKEGGRYDQLNSSMKLKLLNFLCDEVLGTEKIRNWIGDQNIKFAEQTKEAKERLVAAKDKEKCLKQKMVDDVAKAVIARNGVSLIVSEHEAVVSEIKKEVAQAHAEMLEFKRMVSIDKQRPDAVRTEPIFRDRKGNVYWRLKGYSDKSDILLQDIGTGDVTVESGESWFQFDPEQMTLIDKHINALREGRFRPLA